MRWVMGRGEEGEGRGEGGRTERRMEWKKGGRKGERKERRKEKIALCCGERPRENKQKS